MNSYSAREVFSVDEMRLLERATAMVELLSGFDGVRCHELSRACALVLELPDSCVQDGHYGLVEHSWLWTAPIQEGRKPNVLDVYTVGRLPQVQLISTSHVLQQPYRVGPPRVDIFFDVVEKLVTAMRVIRAW